MIRPEILIVLRRWQEVILAASLGLFGLWLMVLGGYILMPIGAALVILALSMIILALRRLRFARQTGAIGIVELTRPRSPISDPQRAALSACKIWSNCACCA
jgi:hypothetical protein